MKNQEVVEHYPQLDFFKFIAAILVITIYTQLFCVSNQLRVPSKTKPRIVAGFKTSCNGLDIFLEFQAPREAVHPESLNLCHSYVWEFR